MWENQFIEIKGSSNKTSTGYRNVAICYSPGAFCWETWKYFMGLLKLFDLLEWKMD